MKIINYVVTAAVIAVASPAFAQTATPIDCTDPANAGIAACFDLTPPAATFSPLVIGAVGLFVVIALASGGGSTSTGSTTGTTP